VSKKRKPKSKGRPNYELADHERQVKALVALEQKPITSYREAERVWELARRNAPTGEIVTSWSGVVT
jgi:hypothetical protein